MARPIDEAGRINRQISRYPRFAQHAVQPQIARPAGGPGGNLPCPTIKFTEQEPLLSTLPAQPTKVADKTVSMEDLDQGYGFIDYRKKFDNGLKGALELKNASDYTLVMVNGKIAGEALSRPGHGQQQNHA